jgi:hypothetical protein
MDEERSCGVTEVTCLEKIVHLGVTRYYIWANCLGKMAVSVTNSFCWMVMTERVGGGFQSFYVRWSGAELWVTCVRAVSAATHW